MAVVPNLKVDMILSGIADSGESPMNFSKFWLQEEESIVIIPILIDNCL